MLELNISSAVNVSRETFTIIVSHEPQLAPVVYRESERGKTGQRLRYALFDRVDSVRVSIPVSSINQPG
jgi:hypothetical protein